MTPSEGQAHSPKRLALAAMAANRLSRDGRRRLRRHIDACDVCRAEWPRMKAALQAVREARGEPPILDWERMERTLSHVALEESRQLRTLRTRERWQKRSMLLAAPVAIALAAAAAYVVGVRHATQETTSPSPVARRSRITERERPPAPVEERPVLEAVPTLLAGSVRVRSADGAESEASIRSALREGQTVRVEERGAWAARFCVPAGCDPAGGTAIALEGPSEVTLASLRSGWVRLELARGAVVSDVRRQGEAERFEVRAGDVMVRVRGTRFRISLPLERDPTQVEVAVSQGVVEVVHIATGRRNVLEAPAAVRFVRGVPRDRARLEEELPPPHGFEADLARWVDVRIGPLRRGLRGWRIDQGAVVSNAATLRVRPGPATVEWTFVDGRTVRVPVDLSAGLTVEPAEAPAGAPRAIPASGSLPRAAVSQVVARGMPAIRSCYEHRLRRRPDLAARVTVQIRIGLEGAVDEVRLVTPGVPSELRDCVLPAVRGWRFPAPEGGSVVVQVPLAFAAR